jgi:hypothetical protein
MTGAEKDDPVRQSNSAAAAWLQHGVLARCIVDRLADQESRATDRRQDAIMRWPTSPGTALVLAPADTGRTMGGTGDY